MSLSSGLFYTFIAVAGAVLRGPRAPIIFGLLPATAAMFAVARKWAMGEVDVPIFRTFWSSYRKEFWKVHTLGVVLTLIGFVYFWI
jgi:uncharacterized membrane protein YesL